MSKGPAELWNGKGTSTGGAAYPERAMPGTAGSRYKTWSLETQFGGRQEETEADRTRPSREVVRVWASHGVSTQIERK